MENLTPFEKGLLTSLIALTSALKNTPGFDAEELNKALQIFIDYPLTGCTEENDKLLYEAPLKFLKSESLARIQTHLNNHKEPH